MNGKRDRHFRVLLLRRGALVLTLLGIAIALALYLPSTNDRIGEDLIALGALTVLVHHSTIGEEVVQRGGGGVNCNPRSRLFGSPAYATYEDNAIGGDVSITGWASCWLGFIRNTSQMVRLKTHAFYQRRRQDSTL